MKNSDNFLTKDIFEKCGEKDKYYNERRWQHFSEILTHLEKIENLGKVLEIGPYKTPFVKGSDIMDIKSYDYPFKINKFIKHDCSKVPFPIKDKEYDLVIASQVLEHLGVNGEQIKVFDEIERISSRAIISLPYNWNAPSFRTHHRIDRIVFDAWASQRKYSLEEISGDNALRILRIYKFE